MIALLLGLTQYETLQVAAILHFLEIETVDRPQELANIDFIVTNDVRQLRGMDEMLPVILIAAQDTLSDSLLCDHSITWLPLPWRYAQLKPFLQACRRQVNLPMSTRVDLNLHVKHLESLLIRQALLITNGVVSQAAQNLQIQRTTLIEKMRRYNIDKSEF